MGAVRVTFLVPCREFDTYLDQAVESILGDMARDDELVVVVDGPLPEAPHPSWVEHPQVRLCALGSHRGTPVALNVGVEIARGEFVARLDADDLARPGRRAACVDAMRAEPSLVAIGTWARLIDPSGNTLGLMETPVTIDDVARELRRRNCLVHSSVFFRTDALREVGGYNRHCLRMQDYELFLRLARIGPMKNLATPWIDYRTHPNQASRATSPYSKSMREVIKARTQLAKFQGAATFTVAAESTLWWAAQVLRHHGLRKPRYMAQMGAGTGTS